MGEEMKMYTDILSPPYSQAIEKYLKTTANLVLVMINEQFSITDCNRAFTRIMKSRDTLIGKNIFEFLIKERMDGDPFKDPSPERSQRLIFIARDNSSFSLDCTICHTEKNYLMIGGHLMLASDDIIKTMTLMSNELINITRELHNKNRALEEARAQIKVLRGIIPICSYCKQIRDDKGYWNQLEKFLTENSEAFFSHGICPKCLREHHPEFIEDDE